MSDQSEEESIGSETEVSEGMDRRETKNDNKYEIMTSLNNELHYSTL